MHFGKLVEFIQLVIYLVFVVIQIYLGIYVYILVRHSLVILLLPWFCREHKTGVPFVHCYFILYTSVTSCVW